MNITNKNSRKCYKHVSASFSNIHYYHYGYRFVGLSQSQSCQRAINHTWQPQLPASQHSQPASQDTAVHQSATVKLQPRPRKSEPTNSEQTQDSTPTARNQPHPQPRPAQVPQPATAQSATAPSSLSLLFFSPLFPASQALLQDKCALRVPRAVTRLTVYRPRQF